MSTTVVNPVPAARPRGADPAGPLPVLAVDLVTDPPCPAASRSSPAGSRRPAPAR